MDKTHSKIKKISPVVQICGVGCLGPEVFQQGPGRAVWYRFR